MPSKKRRPKDPPEKQHARFVEAAKQAEADDSPDAMSRALKKIILKGAPKKQSTS
jgi:hypothetical protein